MNYKFIIFNLADKQDKEVGELLQALSDGWEIISDVGLANGVAYILKKK